jgi:cell division septation protein DedD
VGEGRGIVSLSLSRCPVFSLSRFPVFSSSRCSQVMEMQRQPRVFEVTVGQIFVALIIGALALTAVFEAGVWVGKKRVIDAERKAALQSNMQMRAAMGSSTEGNSGYRSSPGQSAEELEAGENTEPEASRRDNTETRTGTEASSGGNLPYDSPPELSTENPPSPLYKGEEAEQSDVEEKGVQYTIQVGTFSSRQNARNLVNLLESYEYRSWLMPESDTGEMLYRVFIGRFDTRDAAEKFGREARERLSYVTEYRIRKIQE